MTNGSGNDNKKAAVNGLAVVGFAALIIAGIFLAVYAARYVPEALSRLSSAVILSGEDANNNQGETETPTDEPSEEPTTPTQTPSKPTPTYTLPTTPVVVPSGPRLYGLPDLALMKVEVGYMRGSTFVKDNEVPENRDGAVRFTVINYGTNIAYGWRVRVDVEGEGDAIAYGAALYPAGTQNFTLRIEDPRPGRSIDIDIDVDYQNTIVESNERNNDKTVDLDIEND